MNLPVTLKKQVAVHAGLAVLLITLFFLTVTFFRDPILAAPFVFAGIFIIVKEAILLYNCIAGNYLEIKGVCHDVETTGFRKRIRSITLKSENKLLKLPIHYRLKNVNVGDNLIVYMSKQTQLYYKDGTYIADKFYGISVGLEE